MAQVHLHIPSFNAGELSPLMGARFGVEKVSAGCRRLRNFIIHPHGPAFRRPGMEWMGASASDAAKSRLIGFNFSTSTGAVLEFHPDGLRVWSNGVLVPLKAPVELPYSEAECQEVQMVQVNDVCYLAHPNHEPRRLVRYADDDWRLEAIKWKWPALGDENVRSDEIATPDATEIDTVPTYEYPEFDFPGGAYSFEISDNQTTPPQRVAKLQKWTGSSWATLENRAWNNGHIESIAGMTTAGTLRLYYTGPITLTGDYIRLTWNAGADEYVLPIDVFQPENLKPITVPVGEWQVEVNCPTTVPAGAKLYVQKVTGGVRHTVKILTPVAGESVLWRGPTITTPTVYLLNWLGRACMDGEASASTLAFPTTTEITLAVSAVSGTERTMTASKPIFVPGHVGSYWQITHRRDSAYTQIVGVVGALSETSSTAIRVSGQWDVFTYGLWDTTLFLEKKVGASWEVVRSWESNFDRNVIASGTEDNEVEMRLRIAAGTGDDAGGAAVPRWVLEATDSRVNGLVKVTAVGSLDASGKATTATVDVLTTLHATTATPIWTEGAWSGAKGYPRTVALHGSRLWFGGTRAEPQRLWGSVVNDYQNFLRSSLDDASVSFTPAAQQSNSLQWMASHGDELVIGTSGDEWTIGAESGPITPTSVKMQRRSGYGSAYLPAIILGESIIFTQRGGRKLRQIVPRSDVAAWSAADMTVLAEHVTVSGVTCVAAMSFPQSILWGVTTDGRLLGMTFEQEQNVFGWHVHETDGLVESVAVIFGQPADEVWLAVNRNGKRSIERLDMLVFARAFESAATMIYSDAAVRETFNTAQTTVTGLDHLEGKEVVILADGAEQTRQVVTSGAVALNPAASNVVVGLPFTSELQPMRVEVQMQDGTSQGRQFRFARVGLYLHSSLGGEVADAPGERFEKINFRLVSTPMDSAPPLFTGLTETAVESRARDAVDVIVRQTGPFPLNVGSIILKGDVYGE